MDRTTFDLLCGSSALGEVSARHHGVAAVAAHLGQPAVDPADQPVSPFRAAATYGSGLMGVPVTRNVESCGVRAERLDFSP
jgi:hypothetical protein